jgi:oxygen-independent coproporphyrinogen-3 oxidase
MAYEAEAGPAAPLGSIFFGGGTPSLMAPATVAALIESAERHWGFVKDIEITLEANPSSVEAARFADLAAAGVNRVSLGLQSLDDRALGFLGRAHDVAEGLSALETAQRHFARVSFDLIYALPGQTAGDWQAELARALGFGTGHLSLYQLTVEPGTRFAALAAKGELPEADPDFAASLYELTQEMTAAAGLPAYEISNHARPGEESRHNLAYWRYRPYLGVGPGAHGRRGGLATLRHRKPENWLAALARNGHGLAEETALTPEERAREALLMGLRLGEGVATDRLEADIDWTAAARLERQGLLARLPGRLRVLPPGRLLLARILAEIVL